MDKSLTGLRFHKALLSKAKIVAVLNNLNPPLSNGELHTRHEIVIIQFAGGPSFDEVAHLNGVTWTASSGNENRKDLSGGQSWCRYSNHACSLTDNESG